MLFEKVYVTSYSHYYTFYDCRKNCTVTIIRLTLELVICYTHLCEITICHLQFSIVTIVFSQIIFPK